jgi:hypothetical protein
LRDRDTEVFDFVKFFNEEIGPYAAHLSEKYGRDYNFKAEGKEEALVSAYSNSFFIRSNSSLVTSPLAYRFFRMSKGVSCACPVAFFLEV